MAKYNLIFGRKKHAAGADAPIEISIFLNGKRKYINSGFRVTATQWNNDKHIVVNHPQADKINLALTNIVARMKQRELDLVATLKPFTINDITTSDKKTPTFLEFAKTEAEERKTCQKSKSLYYKVIDNLAEFAKGDFVFERINLKFIRDFDKFLVGQKLHHNTIVKRHQIVRVFINAAIRDGYMQIQQNPYFNFQTKKIPSERRALESEQLAALESLKVPDNISDIKDMFLFSCYTGLRYSDIIRVSKTDIVRSGNGVYLNLREQKTKKLKTNIPLHILFSGKAVAIIDKYVTKYKDRIFPSYTDQHINRCLKIIGMLLNLDYPLTFHCSRHTFGTTLAEKTQDPYLIKELMNHSDLKTSMIYIHSSKKHLENSLANVDWRL